MRDYEKGKETVSFETLSGTLTVTRKADLYEMDFPAYELKQVPVTEAMTAAIGVRPQEAWIARDLVCVLFVCRKGKRAFRRRKAL